MNKKGAELGIGLFLLIFVMIIVALALFPAIAQNVSESVDENSITNDAWTVAVNTSATSLNGKYVDTTTFVMKRNNGTANVTMASGNYTIANNQLVNGVETATITMTSNNYLGNDSWLSYTYQPVGYIPEAGGRSVAGLILILTAIAIAVVGLVPTLRGKFLELLGK